MTNKLNSAGRLPAEWEPYDAVLMAWPHAGSDWAYMLDQISDCYEAIARAVTARQRLLIIGPDLTDARMRLADIPDGRIIWLDIPGNDTWTRDFGPITIELPDGTPVALDFTFNGWGLKFASDKDNQVTRRLVDYGLICRDNYANRLGFVLEGGSIESDGHGTMLTTTECLLSANRNAQMSQQEIEQYLKETFCLKKIVWLDHGALAGDDTDSHIDTLARLAPGNTIVYTCTDNAGDEHYDCLQRMRRQLRSATNADGLPFNLIELPLPDAIHDAECGERLPATYANYLVMNTAVLVPAYNQPANDRLARQLIQKAYPDREIISIDCTALIRQHGSLHCATMQIPDKLLKV